MTDLIGQSLSQSFQFTSHDLACWGMLDAAQREATRDRLIAGIAQPAPASMAVLIRKWMEDESLTSHLMVEGWLKRRHMNHDLLATYVARQWRWQRWCELYGNDHLATYFLKRKACLDRVSFWHLTCAQQELASEVYQRLREGEVTFDSLQRDSSRLEGHHFQLQFVGPVEIEQVSNELRGLLQSSDLGALWSPRPTRQGSWQIVRLDHRESACLDDAMRNRLLAELGDDVLRREQFSPTLQALTVAA
jgi:hypothetical protein